MKIKSFFLNVWGDERGALISLEEKMNIPFEIKRVFFIYKTMPNVTRGEHAHLKSSQMILCIKGHCKIEFDNGKSKAKIHLNKPNMAVLQKPMIWGKMYDFSEDCVLMVVSDHHYEEREYIRDYEAFLEYVYCKAS